MVVMIRLKDDQTPIINSVIGKVDPGQTISIDDGFDFDREKFDVVSPQPEKVEVKEDKESLSGTVEVEEEKKEEKVEEKAEEGVEEEKEEEEVEENKKRHKLTLPKLVAINGIAEKTAKSILELITYVDEIRSKEKLLREKLNDRFVNTLIKNYLSLHI